MKTITGTIPLSVLEQISAADKAYVVEPVEQKFVGMSTRDNKAFQAYIALRDEECDCPNFRHCAENSGCMKEHPAFTPQEEARSQPQQALKPNLRWREPPPGFISVDERLPPVGLPVVAWFASDSQPTCWTMWLTEGGAWHEDDGENTSVDYFPTHWKAFDADIAPEVKADAGGWIEWKGSECPVPGNTLVEVEMAGKTHPPLPASSWGWSFMINAYRLVQS